MPAAVHLKTVVEPGGRIHFVAPELPEGHMVDVFVVDRGERQPDIKEDLLGWLQSLPSRRTQEEWAQFEKEFREERDSWDR